MVWRLAGTQRDAETSFSPGKRGGGHIYISASLLTFPLPPVPHRKYRADDGSNRTRIRYHVSGPRGKATIYAEVSDRMASHEFVYLIARDNKTGRVFTVSDNRAELARNAPEPSNVDALTRLLKGYTGGG